jgi:tetratricopeptide (TPR) repeat protein
LHLDRRNRLAADGVRKLMEALDTRTIDDETAKLLPVEYCLETVTGTLISAEPPTEKQRDDALRMLDIVSRQRPDLSPRVRYLRAVGLTHARQFDAAATELSAILDPAERPGAVRDGVLFPSWDLALRVHPELVKRLGTAELARPGRRLDAIAAVERHLAKQPEDAAGIVLKRELYATLQEAEFLASSSAPSPEAFNYDYVEQLGQTLIADADPAQVERGLAYLRVAGRGSPSRGPVIFQQLADAAAKLGRADEAAGYLGQIKRSGLNAGPDKLTAENRAIYTDALKRLVDAAVERKDFAGAVDDMRLYVEAGHENAGTLRKLAEYYASSGDELNALLIAERGLLYAKADPDLLAKKDSYYYSVSLDRIRGVRDKVVTWFDISYLVRKSKQVADQKEVDPETLDYGLHLARLARIVAPTSHGAMLSEARLLLRKGDRDAGLSILEDIREQPRGSGDEEDAWFIAVRLLGDLYLDELDRPDLAVGCYTAFREYQKSGADTLFLLGKAYEKSGNSNAAIKSYEAVSMYPQHPRFHEAAEAARRLKGGGVA